MVDTIVMRKSLIENELREKLRTQEKISVIIPCHLLEYVANK